MCASLVVARSKDLKNRKLALLKQPIFLTVFLHGLSGSPLKVGLVLLAGVLLHKSMKYRMFILKNVPVECLRGDDLDD